MKRSFFAFLSTIIFMTGCDSLGTGDSDLLTLKNESIIEVESNEKVVNILFDAAGTWSAESDSDWAVPEQRYGDAGDDITLEVTVYANETGSAREAVIALSCGEQTVETTIDINYEGRTEVAGDDTVYYFDFERRMTETTGKTFQDGHVSRMYEITYTK